MASARPSSTRFCKPVGQLADRRLADGLDLEKVDDVLDDAPMRHLFAQGRAVAQHLPEEVRAHLERAPGHDVVQRRHALEQRDVLEGARDAAARASSGASWAASCRER
jgi:hypothetical protein